MMMMMMMIMAMMIMLMMSWWGWCFIKISAIYLSSCSSIFTHPVPRHNHFHSWSENGYVSGGVPKMVKSFKQGYGVETKTPRTETFIYLFLFLYISSYLVGLGGRLANCLFLSCLPACLHVCTPASLPHSVCTFALLSNSGLNGRRAVPPITEKTCHYVHNNFDRLYWEHETTDASQRCAFLHAVYHLSQLESLKFIYSLVYL